MSQPQFHKTRIAPTPSGFLHLGNALSFALTAAIAERSGAKILLRIDDLDRERVNREYVQDIFDTLNFLQIHWHEGPRNYEDYERDWSQTHRLDLYNEALKQLRDKGKVFACSCSRAAIKRASTDDSYPGTCLHKSIDLDAPDSSWRLITEADAKVDIRTYPEDIIETRLPANMRYFVVRKKDDYPAYQLSSIIDDLHFGVDLIVRGQDLWASTIAQEYLAQQMGLDAFGQITFYHHPLLMETGGLKLSKSAGSTSIKYLRDHGHSAMDVYGMIGRMAGIQREVKDWQELGKALLE
ncbi:glutamyl-tRNA synthetase [Mucilaginibacter yixingensis]|uniref:Glutamyl-tRNA synthetase n=1 Tax=Mucilaginibacter yixingensis TaxID=1295612 RepID=A0A2T5JCF5_9SPHI|nr:glutamate--tRNA ligase family protein [Mucilaginibacter yixingensis]PTQ99444.1 glutamyl-tRNA synthetase [Mucilaginibacter yixingensis]